MSRPARGLKNLRTLSGRVAQVAVPYRSYMQITCLEMEKARRGAERKAASRHIADIDARLREIEKEKVRLLEALDRAAAAEAAAGTAPRHAGSGFRIRY